jgi:parallel beta-helix repeat protein
VTLQNVTIQNAPMDGIYLTSTVDGTLHRTYSQNITIQRCNFIACHRNGLSVIDADDVTIADNRFQDITGDPGAPVDVEPNHPEQHGNRIAIRDNVAYRCYRGMTLSLQFGGPSSENFQGESITGNNVVGVFFQTGISVLFQQAGAIVSGNTITDAGGDGITIAASSQVQVTNNVITNPGRCHAEGNCRKSAVAAGIRLIDVGRGSEIRNDNGNTVTGNTIKDTQEPPSMLYGIDFNSTGKDNIIEGNTVSRFDPARGMVVHVSGNSGSNTISGNSKQ